MIEQEKLQEFCNETFWEFEHFCDYIWKFNLQIDELKSRELEKLQAYFPNNSNRKAMRWHLESQKFG